MRQHWVRFISIKKKSSSNFGSDIDSLWPRESCIFLVTTTSQLLLKKITISAAAVLLTAQCPKSCCCTKIAKALLWNFCIYLSNSIHLAPIQYKHLAWGRKTSLIAALRRQRHCTNKIISRANKKQSSAQTASEKLWFSSSHSLAKATPSPIKLQYDLSQKKRYKNIFSVLVKPRVQEEALLQHTASTDGGTSPAPFAARCSSYKDVNSYSTFNGNGVHCLGKGFKLLAAIVV